MNSSDPIIDSTAKQLSIIIWLPSVTHFPFNEDSFIHLLYLIVILYYDYFLIIDEEVQLFWKRKLSWAAGLFLGARYLTLLGHVPVIFQTFHPPTFNTKVRDIVLLSHSGLIILKLYSRILHFCSLKLKHLLVATV